MSRRANKVRERALVIAALAAACATGPALGRRALSASRADLATASAAYGQVIADARRLEALSRRREVLSDQPRPEPDLVARIGAQMTASGLDPGQVSRVSVTAPQPIGDGALRRQTASLTIAVAAPGDLARWLSSWSAAEPAWTVVGLRLERAGRAATTPFTATISLESLHRAAPPASANTSEVTS